MAAAFRKALRSSPTENTRKHLSQTTRVEAWQFTFPPAPESALPTVVFKADETVYLNGATLALEIPYPPGPH